MDKKTAHRFSVGLFLSRLFGASRGKSYRTMGNYRRKGRDGFTSVSVPRCHTQKYKHKRRR